MKCDNGGPDNRIPIAVKHLVWRRDHGLCQLGSTGCTEVSKQSDHIIGVAESGKTRAEMNKPGDLRLVCVSCHWRKTEDEAARGRARWRRQPERP